MAMRHRRTGSVLLLATLAIVGTPALAGAQTATLVQDGGVLEVRGGQTRIEIPLTCSGPGSPGVPERVRAVSMVHHRGRIYVAARRCGLLRVMLGFRTVTGAEWLYPGQDVASVARVGQEIVAYLVRPDQTRRVVVARTDWVVSSGANPAPAVAPEASEHAAREPVEVHIYRPGPPAPRSDESIVTPPRHGDSWEIGGSLLTSLAFGGGYGPPSGPGGAGLTTRAYVVYRAEFPLMARLELMPFTMSIATRSVFGALAMLSAGLDLQGFGLGFGVGIGSVNELRSPGYEYDYPVVPVFAPSMRIGVVDGLHISGRAGFSVGKFGVHFALTEVLAQIPLAADWALSVRFAYSTSGNLEGQLGLRAWAHGRGEAGSIALRFEGGVVGALGIVSNTGSSTVRNILFLGPGLGIGVEGRL